MNNRIIVKNDRCIKKVFRDRIAFENERKIYELPGATGSVPALYSCGDLCLNIEKKNGKTLSAFLDETGISSAKRSCPAGRDACCGSDEMIPRLAKALADWMIQFQAAFHAGTGDWMVSEDLNPRGMLVTDEDLHICGIDFEYWHIGSKEEAFAALPAMLCSLDLADDREKRLAEMVCESYGDSVEKTLLDSCVEKRLQEIRLARSAMKRIRVSSCGILAGGKGSRMGHIDKAGLMLGDYSFLEHILHTVQCFDRILVNTAETDLHPGSGPMGGLEALLTACQTDTLLVIPCDTPLIRRSSIFRLYQELDEQCEAVICRCGGRVYPTFGIYRKGILPKVCAAVKEKDLRMMSLLDRISVRYAELDIGKELQNVNTPEDLERLQRAYERSHGACPHDLRNNLVKRV